VRGVRLGVEEREAIVLGLARGEPLAQIARRLGRPTSTVSREVARCSFAHRSERGNSAPNQRGFRRQPLSGRSRRRHVVSARVVRGRSLRRGGGLAQGGKSRRLS